MGYDLSGMNIHEVSVVDSPCTHLPMFAKRLSDSSEEACTISGHPFAKNDGSHEVFGIVYGLKRAPDCTGDYVSNPQELVDAAKSWVKNGKHIGVQHQEDAGSRVTVLQSGIVGSDGIIDGITVRKGDWVLRLKIEDPALWDQIKSWGPGAGFSIGGSFKRPMEADPVAAQVKRAEEQAMCECKKKNEVTIQPVTPEQMQQALALKELNDLLAELNGFGQATDGLITEDEAASRIAQALRESAAAYVTESEADQQEEAVRLGRQMTGIRY